MPDLFSRAPDQPARTRSVTVPSDAGSASLGDHKCSCGAVGILSDDWFLGRPERATWHCAECFEVRRNKKLSALS